MPISQAAPHNIVRCQKMRQFGKMCGLISRHHVTLCEARRCVMWQDVPISQPAPRNIMCDPGIHQSGKTAQSGGHARKLALNNELTSYPCHGRAGAGAGEPSQQSSCVLDHTPGDSKAPPDSSVGCPAGMDQARMRKANDEIGTPARLTGGRCPRGFGVYRPTAALTRRQVLTALTWSGARARQRAPTGSSINNHDSRLLGRGPRRGGTDRGIGYLARLEFREGRPINARPLRDVGEAQPLRSRSRTPPAPWPAPGRSPKAGTRRGLCGSPPPVPLDPRGLSGKLPTGR